MASLKLRPLWQLHQIDSAIVEIRQQAAALDPGRRIQGELATLKAEQQKRAGEAKRIHGEVADLELLNKSLDDKIKKIDREVYGGKVVNPREVENLQKEIDMLKKQRSTHDEQILALWDQEPAASQAALEVEKRVGAAEAALAEHQRGVRELKLKLEAEFKARSAERPAAAKAVDPALLARYEGIRQKHDGLGMTSVDKRGVCILCGTLLPRKTVEAAHEDKVATCETCHRIVYVTEGLI